MSTDQINTDLKAGGNSDLACEWGICTPIHDEPVCRSPPAWLLPPCSLLQCTTPNNNLPAARRLQPSPAGGRCQPHPRVPRTTPRPPGHASTGRRQRARAGGSQQRTDPAVSLPATGQPSQSWGRGKMQCCQLPPQRVPSTSSLSKTNNPPHLWKPCSRRRHTRLLRGTRGLLGAGSCAFPVFQLHLNGECPAAWCTSWEDNCNS